MKFVQNFVSAYFKEDEVSLKLDVIQSNTISKFIGRYFATWEEFEKFYGFYGEIAHQLSVSQVRGSFQYCVNPKFPKLDKIEQLTKNDLFYEKPIVGADDQKTLDAHNVESKDGFFKAMRLVGYTLKNLNQVLEIDYLKLRLLILNHDLYMNGLNQMLDRLMKNIGKTTNTGCLSKIIFKLRSLFFF